MTKTHPMKTHQIVTMSRPFNFSAGPAMLPESILVEAGGELLNWNGLERSVMEVGHRTQAFQDLLTDAKDTLRELLAIPPDYQILFLGGAARTQFAMIPMNLLSEGEKAAYLVSGVWSSLAFDEASRLAPDQAYCIASNANSALPMIPEYSTATLAPNTAYFYYTPNETINGIRFPKVPSHGRAPLIADMTSCLLTEPIHVADYDLLFAGAQKNIGPAGLTIVILRNQLLDKIPQSIIPTMLDYRVHAKHHSLYATPPTFNCYMAAKMFHWIKGQGGVESLYQQNVKKAAALYDFIDESPFYDAVVTGEARSIVNVCFKLNRPELETEFFKAAEKRSLFGLKGHKLVGGIRASLYNAMPMAGVEALIGFLHDFSEDNS